MASSNLQPAAFESEQLISNTEFSLDINELRDELQEIEEDLEEVEAELEEIEDALEAGVTDSDLEELEDEIDEIEDELEDIEEDLDDIEDALEAAPKSSQVEVLLEEVEELEEEIDEVEDELEEVEDALESDIEDDESDADVEELEDKIDEIEDELEELEEDLEEVEEALESSPDAEKLEELEDELDEIEEEFEELEEDLEEIEDALEALPEGRDVAELEADIEEVEAELEEFETELEAIEQVLEAQDLDVNDGADSSDDPAASEPILPEFDAAQFRAGEAIDNPYFPLLSGSVLSYSADIFDAETGEVSRESNQVFATFETKTILGVEAQVIRDRAYENGVLVEDTADWYAQDISGNIWYMGELAINYEYDDAGNLTGTNTDGSWEAGVDGALPGYLMPANPQVGDRYYQEFRVGEAEDQGVVISLNESVTIGLDTYTSVLKTRDFTDLEPDVFEFKYYAPGVGQILAEEGIPASGGKPEASPELIHVAATTSRMEFGGAEADILYGSNVSEVLDGDRNDDFLFGNGGQDVLIGGMGDDVIFGGAQADSIFGGAGDDLIYANGGGDWISSGSGMDRVWLGSGPATIRLATGEGYASIHNFQLGSTQLRVSDVSQLSFSDTANGVAVFQGSDQIAEVAWQSAETFAKNLSQIF